MSLSLFLFILISVINVFFNWWFSIKDDRYHGIPRFFSFEAILALLLLNHKFWFFKPFSLGQILSWSFLFFSLYLAVYGFYTLKKSGEPDQTIENTTSLITDGLFKHIRHPLYASLIALGIGVGSKHITFISSILMVLNLIAMWITALIEEKEMLARFPDGYKEYMKKTKRFVPYIF